ncbi:MAG: DNA translocase FtsK 4TM domain-containing protein, partial [Rhizobiales bacterium]|nr:DNA translocase FtsK 4TM domain-containing protein [Hyphomicrobiales bacterium]
MRQSSARHASLFPEEVVSAFHRRLAELRGFAMIAFAAICLVALGTWAATDPNYAYATDGAVKNLMGRAGAAFSDFMMQVFGLGSLAVVLPLAVWGWLVMTHRGPPRWKIRILFWLAGALLACGFAACFRSPAGWPLPTGLGGAIGDSLIFVPSLLLGSTANASRILMGLLFGMPMLFAAGIALGAGFRNESPPQNDFEDFDPETGEVRERIGFFTRVSAFFGGVFHFFYMV